MAGGADVARDQDESSDVKQSLRRGRCFNSWITEGDATEMAEIFSIFDCLRTVLMMLRWPRFPPFRCS